MLRSTVLPSKPLRLSCKMQRHPVLPENARQPGRRLGVEVLAPERAVAREQRNLALRLPQGGGGLDGDVAAADDDDLAFQRDHLLERARVADGAQVDDVAQVRARDLRTQRAAAGGEAGFLELDGLSVAQHREAAVEVELRDHRVQPQVDLSALVPVERVVEGAFHARSPSG